MMNPEKLQAEAPRVGASLVEEFGRWMSAHRGVTRRTLDRYERDLRPFLATLGDDPARYEVVSVRDFVIDHLRHRGRSQAKQTLSAMRALLRFLAAEGRCRPDFAAALPRVPQWRLSALPRYLEPEEVERVIGSCDVRTPRGLRDRAILLLLSRLGLRAGDVIALRLTDVEWEAGALRVCGKGRRETALPLTQEVGDALLAYLERGRERIALDSVFLGVHPPFHPLRCSTAVSRIVQSALRRAHVYNPPSRGAHLLRHSAATAMLRAGGTLESIAMVLRHRSTLTTAHYAKVDIGMLLEVVQPWPRGAAC
jgi:site-specific recombinase XerD